jgi:CubicO group peptidase (beta-lactamase class C family)
MQQTIRAKKSNGRLIAAVLALGAIVVLAAFVVIPRLQEAATPSAPAYWPTEGWRSSPPEAQGIDSDKLAEAVLTIQEQNIPVHSLLLIRNGQVVTDATFYPYDGQTVHDMASVTKSVMTTLIGIAVDQGKLSLDDPMISFFPDRAIANLDEAKQRITVRHLVSMSSGLACHRDGKPGDSSLTMQDSPDFVQFALDREVAWEPGSHFIYCSPAIHLLSPILEQATGMTTLAFAQQYLFEPLGIEQAMWEQDPQGYYDGWGDLSLLPQDMAKIGFLFLQKGEWDGQQIVSREWVEAATAAQAPAAPREDRYGYGWWMNADIEGSYRADGRNGQYIIALPAWDMLVVTTGGGFDIDQIGELLLASFTDLENALPANPEGVARLEAAIAAVAQPPPAWPVAPLPEMARAISGQTYVFEPNPAGLNSLAVEFNDSAEAVAHIAAGDNPMLTAPVGLDGVYRFSSGGFGDDRPLASRGRWANPQTLILEVNGVTTNDQTAIQLRFQDDRVAVTVSEAYGMPGVEFGGWQEP